MSVEPRAVRPLRRTPGADVGASAPFHVRIRAARSAPSRCEPAHSAFKVGINKPRSRGDRDEPFGGRGASWKGAFVGGDLLVEAVTTGATDGRLFGNFPDYNRYPTT